ETTFFFYVVEKFLFLDFLDGGQGGSATNRVAAERRDVPEHRVVSETGHDLLAGDKRSDREAATQRLGQGEDVRDDAELFECKESSCPAHAALDLVEYKEGAGFGTSFPDGLH